MSPHEYNDAQLDDLFRQALRPYQGVRSPHNVLGRTKWRIKVKVQVDPPNYWQRVWIWFSRPLACQWPISHQPFSLELHGTYAPSPFLGVMVKQVLDLKLAS